MSSQNAGSLKTLKDIGKSELVKGKKPLDLKFTWPTGRIILSSDLKQEAIKWVKWEDEQFGYLDDDTKAWIITFFNLTEEDLR